MPVLGRDSRRFQRGRGRGGVAGARFPVGSPVPGGRWKSPCRYGVESQLIENFLKKFLAKSLADCEKAVLLRSCSAGAGQGREGGRGGGSRGEKNFSKNFSEKVWRFEKKMYFCTPKRKEGAGLAGRPGAGARRKPGREPGRTRNGEFIDTLRQKQ